MFNVSLVQIWVQTVLKCYQQTSPLARKVLIAVCALYRMVVIAIVLQFIEKNIRYMEAKWLYEYTDHRLPLLVIYHMTSRLGVIKRYAIKWINH